MFGQGSLRATHETSAEPQIARSRLVIASLVLLTLSLVLHFAQFGRWLDNNVITGYSPGSNDPADYARRAENWIHHGGFSEAFADGYRVPGYSAYLLPFLDLFAKPYLAARFVQLLLSASLPVLMLGVGVLVTRRLLPGVVAGLLSLCWIPLSYFAPILVPETQSLIGIALLCACLARRPAMNSDDDRGLVPNWRWQCAVGALLAVLIYLKPNHVLLMPPVIAFIVAREWGTSWTMQVRAFAPACCVAAVLVAPWSFFASRSTGMFVPLSTTQGLNLYLGAGLAQSVNSELGLHDVVAQRFGLFDREADARIVAEVSKLTIPEAHRVYQRVALAAWSERPLATAAFGLAKVAHSFGGSLRNAKDAILLLHSSAVLVAIGLLWKRREHRDWCLFLGLSLVFEMAQAFWFLPNIRFKTIFVDLQATLILAFAADSLWRHRSVQNSTESADVAETHTEITKHRRAA